MGISVIFIVAFCKGTSKRVLSFSFGHSTERFTHTKESKREKERESESYVDGTSKSESVKLH